MSFNRLGDSPHVQEMRPYQGQVTVDAFITPGVVPFQAPGVEGIVRCEEDDTALRYNG